MRFSVALSIAAVMLTTGCTSLSDDSRADARACEVFSRPDPDHLADFSDQKLVYWRSKANQLSELPGMLAQKLAIASQLKAYSISSNDDDLVGISFDAEKNASAPLSDSTDLLPPPQMSFYTRVIDEIWAEYELGKVASACRKLGVEMSNNSVKPAR